MKLISLCISLILFSNLPQAAEWSAIQGDVVSIKASFEADKVRLWCFGKKWPAKLQADGSWKGWIGIDLKTKPGTYPIEWSNGKRIVAKDSVTVSKGEFRISHITVEKKMADFDAPTLKRIRSEAKLLRATYIAAVDATPDIHMDGKPAEGIESTPFGAQRYVNGAARSPHSGIDIAAPAGTPITAPLAGKVLHVADMYLNGKTVAIGHGNGLVSVYSHMQSTDVTIGQWIQAHQKIGEMGSTGRATGPHLHWGVRFHNARVNPESLL
ncbi:murein DD-endopeptidase MepM [Mariprofundus micogutta]|uniref:Murein DD-endopeptidase MepM n=1 Tax=Mariprofundus micogutta TaxID=1921010 RepID=A0A1L8CKS3_9PROT|nr:M23 family metallopeptidase [Mariprofundus micogutta]GAV19506.1 murein DD-endopeptidase MepM [Mariprofundus micogutta]